MNPASPPESAPENTPSVSALIESLDFERLERLVAIGHEQGRIQAFRNKAQAHQDQVPPAVRARVLADYEHRAAALEEEAAPLRADVRSDYEALQAAMLSVQGARTDAQERRQEAEFRHEVGELTDEELANRLAGPSAILEQCERDVAALEAASARFIAALGEGFDIKVDPDTRHVTETPVSTPRLPPLPMEADIMEAVQPAPSDMPAVPARGVGAANQLLPLPGPVDSTFALPRDQVEAHLQAAPPAPSTGHATLVLEDDGDLHEFHLGDGVTAIGRGDQNDVQIVKPGISRKHAVLERTPDGYLLRDLESNNGTWVNGERITERVLENGDVVEIGPIRLLFRA